MSGRVVGARFSASLSSWGRAFPGRRISTAPQLVSQPGQPRTVQSL